MDYEKVIKDLIAPFVSNPDEVEIVLHEQKNLRDYEFTIYCKGEDLPALIGKKGTIANSLREVANVSARLEHNRLRLKFEEQK